MTEPERLDRFMARANAAYYAQRDPFADFTTAPEISQIFGELLGAWAAVVWTQIGRPDPVLLVEAGPGRGTLMQDALRIIARVAPDFAASLRVHLIETSPRLRIEQAKRIAGAIWHDRLEDVPPGPMILLANEFLDALPIRQFERIAGAWAERHVLAGRFVALPCAIAGDDVPDGAILEVCEPARAWVATLSERLVRDGGAALLIDYGDGEHRHRDTLQALRDGKPADPLADPGSADLTAHVDFAALASVAREKGAHVCGPVTQGDFLRALGIEARTERLAASHPDRRTELEAGRERLISAAQMGTLFKAFSISASTHSLPFL